MHEDAGGARARRGRAGALRARATSTRTRGPGYWIAGHLLERAHEPLRDDDAERVLGPLGIDEHTFDDHRADLPAPLANVPTRRAQRVVRPIPRCPRPYGSLFASATTSPARTAPPPCGAPLDGRAVLTPDVARSMLTPPTRAREDADTRTALAYARATAAGRSHYGFRAGSGAVFTLVRSSRRGDRARERAGAILGRRAGGVRPSPARRDGAQRRGPPRPDPGARRSSGYAAGPTAAPPRTPAGTVYRYGATEETVAVVTELHVGPRAAAASVHDVRSARPATRTCTTAETVTTGRDRGSSLGQRSHGGACPARSEDGWTRSSRRGLV